MTLFQLHAKQALAISKKEAWDFLSDPANLLKITPPSMGFKILNGTDKAMFPGQIIQYSVQPFPGITTRWVTEITHVLEGSYFVDEQRFGPYAFWHHKHFIKEIEQGVLIEDVVDYKLPFGAIGAMFHSPLVKNQLKTIFKFREEKLAGFFGNLPQHTPSISLHKI